MNKAPRPCVLTFATTSHVYQAERTLRMGGLLVGLRPVPQGVPSRCGVCLQGDLDQTPTYLTLLTGALSPVGMYVQSGDAMGWTPVGQQAENG